MYSEEKLELRDAREKLVKLRLLVRSMDRGIGYRDPYDHDTYGAYAEGKHDLAGEVEEILDGTDL